MKDENLLIGALGSAVADLFIDILLSKIGALTAIEFHDSSDRYIWGYGTGDAVVDGVGITMFAVGQYAKKMKYKEIGVAWLLTHGMIKLSELYGYIRDLLGITYTPHKIVLRGSPQTLKTTRFRKTRFWTLKVKH